ncbi:hypothetical protein [Mannheimia pernigra]|uniref:hypothetical protein n=1 Tax=Mannheimia pernigra TaxID=111844 RepID=UPI0013188551|nr:hypothetical protein [Mannheimia pernigra]QHB16917.1 hypothetical protein GM695_02015 [Mannheimia pernigra]
MVSQQQAIEAFYRLYQAYHNKRFTKTLNFTQKTEREILSLVRSYLLGYFEHLEPEAMIQVGSNYRGRFDFLIDNIAVEFAVRSANKGGNNLKAKNNVNEMKKLIRYPDHSLMILFDFKRYRTDDEVIATLKEYRNIPSLGRGNHNRYPFTVAYFYQDESGDLCYYTKRIRVKRRAVSLTQDKNIIEEFKVINQRGLIATEFDVESGEYIQEYEVEIRVKGNELTIEYRDNEGDYHQYKGIETETDIYELTSTENPTNKAIVSLFIDEEEFLSIEGDLIEDNHKKEWIIERK